MSLATFTDSNFQSEVLASPDLTLVDFWAPWCAPCKHLTPIVEELAKEFMGRLKAGTLDIQDNMDVAAKFGVKSVPMVMLFKGGQRIENVAGVQSKDFYKKLIEQHL